MNHNPYLPKLGFSPTDRVAIVHTDDIGMCQATLPAIADLLDFGLVTSAAIMVPCPWFQGAAQYAQAHPGADFGVHLTLNSEWSNYRWGPVSTRDPASGLMDDEGYFFSRTEPTQTHADVATVRRELDAQLAMAKAAGITPTHADTHMFCVGHPRLFAAYVQAALDAGTFPLAFLPGTGAWRLLFGDAEIPELAQAAHELADRGLPLVDDIQWMNLQTHEDRLEEAKTKFAALQPGITHFLLHPSVDTPELRAIAPDWRCRVADYETFMSQELKDYVKEIGVQLVGYRDLLKAMRAFFRISYFVKHAIRNTKYKGILSMNYFLGIDIGATKSHALIADETGQAVGFGTAGPGNHEVVGYGGLIAVLNDITQQALNSAGITRADVAGAGFGVAGYDWPSERDPTLEAIATLGLSCPVEAVNDTVIGLLAGVSEGWGVAIVMGTGENCWGWDQERRTGHVTGNGGYFAEFGGGGALVRRAIQAVSKAWSLRGPQTALTEAFCQKTGAKDAEDLLEGLVLERYRLYSGNAPLVFQTAHAGDDVAKGVIAWAGEQLADLAIGVIRQLNFEDREFEIILIGSLYEGGALILDPLKNAIWQVAPRAKFVRLNAPPVVGGVLLGMEMGGVNGYAVRERLIETTPRIVKI